MKQMPCTRSKGATLIEVLVALVVFTVGVVGIAALLMSSVRSNEAAFMRSQSSILANEMFENILANLEGARGGFYNLSMSSSLPTSTSNDCLDLYNSGSPSCTPQQLAAWDLARWGARVSRTLVNADAEVVVGSSAGGEPVEVVVRFVWLSQAETDISATAGVSASEQFTFQVMLPDVSS